MARPKQNVDAYGKSWSPIDIPNLEKAVKLYERLNYLQDHFAGSLSGSNKIMAQINEQAEIKQELEKTGIKLTEEQTKKVLELFRIRQAENKLANNSYGNITPQSTHLINRAQSITNNNGQTTLSMNNAGSFIAGAAQQHYAQRQMDNNLKYFQDIAKSMGRDPNSKMVSKLAENKTVNQLSESSGKFNTAASLIQVAANTFSKAVSTFSGLFFRGLHNQANVYEDTFTNISVRNGTTRGQYLKAQTRTPGMLNSMGLGNNVRVSDIQTMWNTLASQGIKVDLDSEKTLTRAIETAVTSTIVPYLNVSDEYFQQLVDQQPSLMKYVRGIGAATQEVSGNSVFVNKYLQDMIDNLAPMAAVAENTLGVQFAQMSGTYEALRSKGYSDALIGELYKGSASVYRDPLAALRSGNLDAQLAVVNGIANGIDFRDANQVSNQYLRSANFVANLTPEGKMSPIYAGASPTLLSTMGKVEMNERNISIEEAIAKGIETAEKTPRQADKKTEDYQNDVNNTLKQMQETELENLSTWLAAIYEQIGYWGDIVSVLLKGIAGVIGAKLIGGLFKGSRRFRSYRNRCRSCQWICKRSS